MWRAIARLATTNDVNHQIYFVFFLGFCFVSFQFLLAQDPYIWNCLFFFGYCCCCCCWWVCAPPLINVHKNTAGFFWVAVVGCALHIKFTISFIKLSISHLHETAAVPRVRCNRTSFRLNGINLFQRNKSYFEVESIFNILSMVVYVT